MDSADVSSKVAALIWQSVGKYCISAIGTMLPAPCTCLLQAVEVVAELKSRTHTLL